MVGMVYPRKFEDLKAQLGKHFMNYKPSPVATDVAAGTLEQVLRASIGSLAFGALRRNRVSSHLCLMPRSRLAQRRQKIEVILLRKARVAHRLARTRAGSSVAQKPCSYRRNDAPAPKVAGSVRGKADGSVMRSRM